MNTQTDSTSSSNQITNESSGNIQSDQLFELKQHELATINAIKNIKTIEELAINYPHVLKNPKKDHPKFLELEKKKILLWMEIWKTSSETKQKLQKSLYEIEQGYEIWPESLKKLDAEYEKAVKSAKGNLADPEIRKASEKKTKAFIDFQNSKEYKEFISKNEQAINKINSELISGKTPEVKLLESEIETLSKEVYY